MPIDPSARRLLRMTAAVGAGAGATETPISRRQGLEVLAEIADHDVAEPITTHVIPAAGRAIPLHVYGDPFDGRNQAPVLLFLHGGGWVAGGPRTHGGFCRRLSRASGARVALVDYRLAPEHPFPAALDDCLEALRWIGRHGRALGLDPERLAVGGDSVGAGLAAAAIPIAREFEGPRIALQVLICPILDPPAAAAALDASSEGAFISREVFGGDLGAYLAGHPANDPRVAPLRAASFADQPPALIETAEFDPFAADGARYAAALRGAGVEVRTRRHAGMIHYFYALARAIPYADRAAELIGADIAAALAAPRRPIADPIVPP